MSKSSRRELDPNFINELKEGSLKRFLELINRDNTLCMEIRHDEVHIYYRGGRIIKITHDKKRHTYSIEFDENYFQVATPPCGLMKPDKLPKHISSEKDAEAWLYIVPTLKQWMDFWFHEHPKEEREFQQLVVRENNYSGIANGTDYYVCDIEYEEGEIGLRFDLVAAHWPSAGAARKRTEDIGLAIIEIKYGESALGGSAGILKHINDLERFLGDREILQEFKKEMMTVFNQKRYLELIPDCKRCITSFSESEPDYILMFANHKPESAILRDVIKEIREKKPRWLQKIKVATANFFGGGLYDEAIYALYEFERIYSSRIFSDK